MHRLAIGQANTLRLKSVLGLNMLPAIMRATDIYACECL